MNTHELHMHYVLMGLSFDNILMFTWLKTKIHITYIRHPVIINRYTSGNINHLPNILIE